jgi:hypothetical protein
MEIKMQTSTFTMPASIQLGQRTIPVEWTENENLDGFIAEIKSGVPVENFASSEDCELAIWEQNAIKSDVYLDGSAVLYFKP